jgi:pimeloyl-ACP methyl ester carboxylesterase
VVADCHRVDLRLTSRRRRRRRQSRAPRLSANALGGHHGAHNAIRQHSTQHPAALRDLPDPIPESFAREFQSGAVYHPVPAEFLDRIIQESLKLPPRLWPVMIDCLLAYDDTRELGGIRAPTQLLWGDHDALFSRAQQDAFLAARLTIYQETGHCPNWERPEWVAADIADFVASATRG